MSRIQRSYEIENQRNLFKGLQGSPVQSYENCKNYKLYENCEIYKNSQDHYYNICCPFLCFINLILVVTFPEVILA